MTPLELKKEYRNTFDTQSGRKVLNHLAGQCYFMQENEKNDPVITGMRNAFIGILKQLDCDDDPERTINGLMSGLLNVPLQTKKKEVKKEEV